MGRKKRRHVSLDNIDDYMKTALREGLEEDAFDANRDIFNLDIKRRKKESKIEFKKRQNRRIKKFVEENLYINKDGITIPIKLIAQQVILLADVFSCWQKYYRPIVRKCYHHWTIPCYPDTQ